MKTMLRTAFAAAALLTAATAFADDHRDHGRDHDRHGYDRGHDGRGWHHDNGWHGHRPPPPPPRPYYGHGYYHGPAYYHRPPPPRYYGHWERGHRYYGRNVVVYDYSGYRLRPPPRGYHWVRENNDFLLVAIATGVILDIATR
ncbi:Nickel/cobalt transporter regulator [Luteibacter sp. UNCMF331Sha3.1]|uniref:RcnB family protein n=1 Tax=Luteibacter sp. UNCMF331Sha3.1 TaxID=1502760 RepID=UPI0008BD1774|nr:Nickel/cobalt transporter regulator [Luteibacter sp. UNCMF331Sha3.1]